jgi:hypothetical protein
MKKQHFLRGQTEKSVFFLGLLAFASVIWLILRTGTKPSRISYPCQKAALTNINVFLVALGFPFVSVAGQWLFQKIVKSKISKVVMIACLLAISVFSTVGTFAINSAPAVDFTPVALDLQSQIVDSTSPSELFIVQNASGLQGNLDEAISALLWCMQSQGLNFFKTSATPSGLIGKNDVIIMKVNGVGPQRANTNTDLAKSLVKTIVAHPDGFTGEIVIADNGQSTGGVNMAQSNAYDHSQSMTDVAGMFPNHKVSAYSWWTIASNSVAEYSSGNYQDGYVVNYTSNAQTGVKVSYPKFQTAYDTYISFKNGVWNQSTGTYDSSRLKVINMPLFKSHRGYGATACVKNYMGLGSQTLTNQHDTVGDGGMGTEIVETRFPTLNILDCIWINANPFQPGGSTDGPWGPYTTYEDASYTNLIAASTDPVALEYWIAKHVGMPTAIQRGYTYISSIDPDYEPVTQNLDQSYHHYLTASMNEIVSHGRQATMLESEMNVYITTLNHFPFLFVHGLDNGVYYRWHDIFASSWNNWMSLPGSTADTPSAVLCEDELHIVVRGMDEATLWHGYINLVNNEFSGWTLLNGATPSAPTLTANNTHICLIVRGNNNSIYYRFYEIATRIWGEWVEVPGGTPDTPAARFVGNKLHLVVKGSNSNQIWYGIVDLTSGGFSDWTPLSGATPSPPTLTGNSTHLCLVVRGNTNQIYCRFFDLEVETWGDWVDLPYGTTPNVPAATIVGEDLHIVVRGMNYDQIWHGCLNLSSEYWSDWNLLDGATTSKPVLIS